jgi:hypothetical protein
MRQFLRTSIANFNNLKHAFPARTAVDQPCADLSVETPH